MKLYHELAYYYFAIEDNHRDINNDINLIRSLLPDRKDTRLLDLGCGTGEHLSLLSKYGINCYGLDNSDDMLSIARKRFPQQIIFVKGDIADFDFYNDFDMVTSLFGSMNYLLSDETVDKAFWNIWRALKDEGTALLEIWNSEPLLQINHKDISRVSTTAFEGMRIDRERGFRMLNDPHGRTLVEVNYRYSLHNSGQSRVITDQHVMRAFKLEEIRPFIMDNGFTIRSIYASTLKEPFQQMSNKMLLLLKKE